MKLLSSLLLLHLVFFMGVESGMQRIDVKVGTGAPAIAGDESSVHYTGWLFDQKAPDKRAATKEREWKREQGRLLRDRG